MVNSTGIMGQLENGSPVSSNHQGVNGGGYNPYTGGSGGSISQATPTGPLNGSDTLQNLADLLGNNQGFPDFGSQPQFDPEIISRMQQPQDPRDIFRPGNRPEAIAPGFGSLPPPQAVGGGMQPRSPFDPVISTGGYEAGGGMQPSTPGFDTDAFSTSILSGVGDLFQEYMGPQQETMPGALPNIGGGMIAMGMPLMPGAPPMDAGMMPDGSPGYDPFDLQIAQREILQQYEGNTPSIQPNAYGFDGPTTGTGTLQEKQLANDGMNTNYNNASGIQSAFRGF